jgi:hypothetical protein
MGGCIDWIDLVEDRDQWEGSREVSGSKKIWEIPE